MQGATDAEATDIAIAIARKTAQSCAITGLAPCGVSKTKHRRPGLRDSFVQALPAGITDRVGRFRQTPDAASVYARRAAIPFPAGSSPLDRIGLDLCAPMFAPCLLGPRYVSCDS